VLGLVAAACGGADDAEPTADDSAASASTSSSAAPDTTAAAEPQDGNLTASPADGWSAREIGPGVKPVLALDSAGSPGIAYLLEQRGSGFVAYAAAAEGWQIDRFVEGYFYGPIGLDYGPDDTPHVVWHDHQADEFRDDLGTLAYASRTGGAWTTIIAEDDGHDGWDSTLVVGVDGIVRAAGIDPMQFDREDGVEFYQLEGDQFTVEAIGSGPVAYEFNVALAVATSGSTGISYHDTANATLRYAGDDGSGWTIETVDEEPGTGKYSSLALDADGRGHIAYLFETGANSGTIRYAVQDDTGGWLIEDIGDITELVPGFTGARRITSIALDEAGVPHVAFSDEGSIWYAVRGDSSWNVTPILSAGDNPLGQLVSMELDSAGNPHIAYFEVTNGSPLEGIVAYLTLS
jgi:hypothetical protein